MIFGGNDDKATFSEVVVLCQEGSENFPSWSWFYPVCIGDGPCARTGHIAVLVDDRNIFFHGGWDPQVSGHGIFH